jgi:hypothetical protein
MEKILSRELLGISSNFGNDKLAKTIFGGCPGERGRTPTEGKMVG